MWRPCRRHRCSCRRRDTQRRSSRPCRNPRGSSLPGRPRFHRSSRWGRSRSCTSSSSRCRRRHRTYRPAGKPGNRFRPYRSPPCSSLPGNSRCHRSTQSGRSSHCMATPDRIRRCSRHPAGRRSTHFHRSRNGQGWSPSRSFRCRRSNRSGTWPDRRLPRRRFRQNRSHRGRSRSTAHHPCRRLRDAGHLGRLP